MQKNNIKKRHKKTIKNKKNKTKSFIIKKTKKESNDHLKGVSLTYVSNVNFFISSGLDDKILKYILAQLNIKYSNNPEKKHLFGFHINRNFFNSKFLTLNRFNNRMDVIDKLKLFLNSRRYFPIVYSKYLPDSKQLTYDTRINWTTNILYLAKPVNERGGKGILYLNNDKSLNNAKKMLKKTNSGFILSQYIINPLLFQGKKMHLRAYVLFTLINNVFKTYLLNIGEIFTAKTKYKKTDFGNLDIHDTHFKYTDDYYLFPRDLVKYKSIPNMETYDKIYTEMRNALNMVSRIAVMNFTSFTNSDNSWSSFGMDYIITDDYNVKILEINDIYTGYCGYNLKECNEIHNKYWNWIKECVILPSLNYNYIPNRNDISNIPITSFTIIDD